MRNCYNTISRLQVPVIQISSFNEAIILMSFLQMTISFTQNSTLLIY